MRSNKVYGRIQNESTYPAQFVSLKALGKIVYLNFEIFFYMSIIMFEIVVVIIVILG